jgi:hypothetical protein
MSDGSPYDEFDCECGAANCRGRISGNDWRRPELWERYAGHFSPYLQRRINHLKQNLPLERRNGHSKVVQFNGRQRELVRENEYTENRGEPGSPLLLEIKVRYNNPEWP